MRVLCIAAAALAAVASAAAASRQKASHIIAAAQELSAPNFGPSVVSVLDYGASSTSPDNTAAFQSALNAAGDAGGGVVWVPAGNFTFQGSLSIPTATALVGTYQAVMAHAVGQNGRFPGQGSVLMPRAGRGNDSATPFVTMADNSQVKGFVFYYPDQVPDAAPVPYPWTINMAGTNPAVLDC